MTIETCPVQTILDVLRGKWKPLILYFLKPGARRYSELHASIDASEKMLVQQLRELERDRIIQRIVHDGNLPQVEYRLTPHGETLIAVLQQMADWGELHRAQH